MQQGFKVLRFWNNDVLMNIDGVLEVIRENCLSHPPLTPPIKGVEREGETHIKGGKENKRFSSGCGSCLLEMRKNHNFLDKACIIKVRRDDKS